MRTLYFCPVVCYGRPYGIGQTIIFSSCGFYLLLSSFFPCLTPAATHWMSTILPHMVWPLCEFRMQVWNVLHTAHWKYRTQKSCKKSPSGHHRTTLSGYTFATKACIHNRKKNLLSSNMSSRCPHNMVNFGPLTAEISSGVWGTPANFNRFRVLAALLHGSQVVSVSQTLRRWSEDVTYVRQGNHDVGLWPTF